MLENIYDLLNNNAFRVLLGALGVTLYVLTCLKVGKYLGQLIYYLVN